MIDLRSDTLSMPDREMLLEAMKAELGDSGRLDENGRGGDPTVNALEDLAAELTGKERALFLPSGTMANHAALFTHCQPGDTVLVDTMQHLYRVEKLAFEDRFGKLRPLFYHLTEEGYPDTKEIEKLLHSKHPSLLCLENTHNSAGGTCIPLSVLEELCLLASQSGIPVHMDGARLFNASVSTGIDVKTICSCADSVMFCISKGLGAPVGSLLCGTDSFIQNAAKIQKLFGGAMRQAGVLASAGIYALKHNIPSLKEDHRRAAMALSLLHGLKNVHVPDSIQSNIIVLDTSGTGITAGDFARRAKEKGVWVSVTGSDTVRLVFCRNISDAKAVEAAKILCSLANAL